jgi:hypothetical protein
MVTDRELLLNAKPDNKLPKMMKDKERSIVFIISGSPSKWKTEGILPSSNRFRVNEDFD